MNNLLKMLVISATLLASAAASAGTGAVQYAFYPDPYTDGRPCFFFYTDYDWKWYAIPFAYANNSPVFNGITQEIMYSQSFLGKILDANPTGLFCGNVPIAAVGIYGVTFGQ